MNRDSVSTPADFVTRSVDWIRSHPNASNQDAPDDLRDAWILPDDPTPVARKSVLAIFLAGYVIAKATADWQAGRSNDPKVDFTATEISEYFDLWQLNLILAKINAGGRQRTSPVPLFSTDMDQEIRVFG